jgi:transcriptional regulator with PAS, ATPase and Fis domain
MRVGETHLRPVDARIVAATNRELARETAGGRFRADLLYRLRVGRIHLPPLHVRLDDLDLLVRHALVEQRAVTAPESRAPVAPAGYGVGMSQVPRHTTEASWHSYVHAS